MQSTHERAAKVRAPYLVAAVVGVHVLAIGSVLFIQGCGTTRQQTVDTPPPPVMPPTVEPAQAAMPRPAIRPAIEMPPAAELEGGQTYVVEKGDSLSRIASRHGVSAREIADLNGIKDPNKIRPGQKLLLPAYAKSSPEPRKAASSSSKKAASSAAAKAGAGEYIVQSGDSLSKIASRHGTTVKALAQANSIQDPSRIRVGQKLVLPGGGKSEPAPAPTPAPAPEPAPEPASAPESAPVPAPEAVSPAPAAPAPAPAPAPAVSADVPFEYTVRQGETLDDVARNFAVLKQDIIDLNGITDPAAVQAGQKLKIPLTSP